MRAEFSLRKTSESRRLDLLMACLTGTETPGTDAPQSDLDAFELALEAGGQALDKVSFASVPSVRPLEGRVSAYVGAFLFQMFQHREDLVAPSQKVFFTCFKDDCIHR
ncbi:MAG TPA: hypothetical protein VGL11_03165 [Candidatus Binatia bacterium]|jgi:hypothetical protein